MGRVTETINAGLRRATGYQLEKPAPPAPQRKDRARRRGSTGSQAGQTRPRRGKAARGRRSREPIEVRARYDDAAVAIQQRVKPRTMTSSEKLFGLVQSVRYLARHEIPGDIVECGVWRGGSMQAAALALLEQGDASRHLHLFDTFEGMSAPTDKDRRTDGTPAEELLRTHDRDHRVWGVAGLEDVKEGMAETGYPLDRVHYHQGMVEQTIPDQAPEQIALLRLDTDWYESTRHELEHLWERLVPGGVLIIDDYGDWEGARLATEEFLAGVSEPLLLLPLGTGRIAVKPLRNA